MKNVTVDKFIKSFESYQKGDSGYCRLASISAEKDNNIHIIGFWYEIIKSNGKEIVLAVQLNTSTKKSYKNTFFIGGVPHLEIFIDDLRLKVQDHLCAILPCDQFKMSNVKKSDADFIL